MGAPFVMYTYDVGDVEILELQPEHCLTLPILYTKERMPINIHHIPTIANIGNWTHFIDIALPVVDSHIGLLLGNNVTDHWLLVWKETTINLIKNLTALCARRSFHLTKLIVNSEYSNHCLPTKRNFLSVIGSVYIMALKYISTAYQKVKLVVSIH